MVIGLILALNNFSAYCQCRAITYSAGIRGCKREACVWRYIRSLLLASSTRMYGGHDSLKQAPEREGDRFRGIIAAQMSVGEIYI